MQQLERSTLQLLAVVSIFFIITSCEKDVVPINEITEITKFESIESFIENYEFLNDMYEKNDEDFDVYVMENNLENSVYKKIANDRFMNPNERYQPFLTDAVMMSIVNEYFEFQIENIIYTYLNNEFLVAYNLEDVSAKNEVRSIKRGDNLQIDVLPKGTVLLTDESYDALRNPFSIQNQSKFSLKDLNQSFKAGSCVKGERDSGWDWKEYVQAPYYEAMSYRTAAYYSWGQTYEESKIYGYTYANGSWSNVKKELWTGIGAHRRDSSCKSLGSPETETQDCDSCKNKRARVTRGGKKYHQTEDVVGHYSLQVYESDVVNVGEINGGHILEF